MSKNFELLRQAGIIGSGEMLDAAPRVSTPVLRTSPLPPVAPKNDSQWLRGLRIVHKHWRIASLFSAVLMITVVVVTFLMSPEYEPVARIEVDPPGETFSLTGATAASDAEYLETQAQNLKSDRLIIEVIRQLHLDQAPEIVNATKKRHLKTATTAYQLKPAENAALQAFHTHLKVKRDSASRLIAVSYWSHDPVKAAQVTNTVVSTFIEDTYRDRHDEIMHSSEWLSRQLDDIRLKMEQSNRLLGEFQRSSGIAELDNNKSTFSEQMAELDRQLTQAQADRIQLEALLRSVQAGSPDALPDIRNNPVVQQLATKLAEQRGELSQAKVVYGPNHPNVKKLQTQVDELQSQLDAQKAAILASVKTSYSAARAREGLMDSEIKETGNELSQMARYNLLKKEAEANSELYNGLYAKVKEAGIAAAAKDSNLHVVDPARVLEIPTRPNLLLNLTVGLVLSLLGGVAVAFVREQFDTRIFTVDDIREWIGTPPIAILPQFFASGVPQLSARNHNNGQPPGAAVNAKLAPGVRFLLDRPHSPEAEALRSLYTSVMLSRPGNPPQVLLVVSSFPGEGKTTVAINLAIAMSQHGSTCLVDSDLRRGRVAAAFGVSNGLGLTDVLKGALPLEHVEVNIPSVPNLSVIAAHGGSINAGQLVCSDTMGSVVSELRKRFQFIVLDTAPILPFADGRFLSTLADGLIFVSRSGITTRQVVLRTMDLLNEVHSAPIIEFVLNAADLNSAEYQYYHRGYEYYHPTSR